MAKRLLTAAGVVALAAFLATPAWAQCASIKDGTIFDSAGNPITLGYDIWGYNYQAHMFNGFYENYTRPMPPAVVSDTKLVMKWSDDWLSNEDCDGDGKLDRGGASGISQGWVTNHFEGTYLGDDGQIHHWTESAKIVYVGPAPTTGPDPWVAGRIWGLYAIIQDVINDRYGGFHGVDRSTFVNPAGLGFWTK